MRRFTPSVHTNLLFDASAAICQASRNIRTRDCKQKGSEFFDFRKDFPNLYKSYNHVYAFGDKHPILFSFTFWFCVFISWQTLHIPGNISAIRSSLGGTERKLSSCSSSLEKLTNEVKNLNETIASFKK